MSAAEVMMFVECKPRLAHGVRLRHSEAHGGWVLLAPERILECDSVAAEVLKRCTGEAGFTQIVDDLAVVYDAPREQIAGDVEALLATLADKRLVEFSDA
jgi:pyrroloquinoline quinone biosynthesis protein D